MAHPRARFHTYRLLARAMAGAPEPVAEAVAAAVGTVMSRRPGPTREMAQRHLRRVIASMPPHEGPDERQLRDLTARSFRAYARYWLEGARLPAVPPKVVLRRMSIQAGWEHLTAGMAAGRGVVMALPHIGSWEWGGAFLALEGYPMTSVAEELEPPELYQWFVEQREAIGLRILPLGGSSTEVLHTLRSGGLVGLLCDRDLVGNGVEVEFFGERTTLPPGPATLALRTGAVLITAAVYSGPGRHHTAVMSAPLDTTRSGGFRTDVARLTQDIARHFEDYIRRAPEQWHVYQPNWPSDHRPGR